MYVEHAISATVGATPRFARVAEGCYLWSSLPHPRTVENIFKMNVPNGLGIQRVVLENMSGTRTILGSSSEQEPQQYQVFVFFGNICYLCRIAHFMPSVELIGSSCTAFISVSHLPLCLCPVSAEFIRAPYLSGYRYIRAHFFFVGYRSNFSSAFP